MLKKISHDDKTIPPADVVLLFCFSMKKLSLHDFEYHISQTTWSTAQDMVSTGRVHDLREVERHFWVAKVTDEEATYESEVIITPSKIKAYACECWSEPRKFMCAHIAANLLQVRRFLDQRTAERARKTAEKAAAQSEITRLSVRHVLPAVSLEDLQEFVKDYARRDADFALALKTRFADMVDGSKKAWHLVLQSVLPKSGKNMREQDFRRLQQTIHDLEARSQKAAQNGDQVIVVKIAMALLEVVGPLVAIAPASRKEPLMAICARAFEQQAERFTPTAPPEFRDDIWNNWMNSVLNGFFPVDLRRDVIRKMSEIAATDSDRFKSVSEGYFQGDNAVADLFIHLYLVCLAKKGVDAGPVKILKDVIAARPAASENDHIAFIRNALLELYYTGCYAAALHTIAYLMQEFTLNTSRRTELERMRFNIAEATNDVPAQLGYLKQTFIQYGHQDTLDRMKQLAAKKWPALLQDLIRTMSAPEHRDKIALLLAGEPDTAVFEAWLDQQADIELTLRYHAALPDTFLLEHLPKLFAAHLNDHFGKPAAEFVRDHLMVLYREKRVDLTKKIIKTVVQQHNGRSGLAETLDEIITGNKMKGVLHF